LGNMDFDGEGWGKWKKICMVEVEAKKMKRK
jgi:hypothetical protein